MADLDLYKVIISLTMVLGSLEGKKTRTPGSISQLVENLYGKHSGYDKNVSPHGANATEVKLGIYINSFHSISEQTMDYSVNIYLRQQWVDPRLRFTSLKAHPGEIKLPLGTWNKIWVPDVTFRNEKKAQYHTITLPNRLMRLTPNGTVWYATKISATLACQMYLWKYPFDTQTCPLMMESFGHKTDTVFFSWLSNAIAQEKNLQLPQFTLMAIDRINCSKTYLTVGYPSKTVFFSWLPNNNVTYNDELSLPQFQLVKIALEDCSLIYSTGTFSCLQANFVLKRSIGYHMIQLYVPSILIVILSWVSFWINCDAAPARVSIGLLTVLTITTQSASARSSLPRVSYVKAIDVWMSMCLLFVFSSFIEFAAVNVFSRRETKIKEDRKKMRKGVLAEAAVNPDEEKGEDENNVKNHKVSQPLMSRFSSIVLRDPFAHQKARFIDKLSRRLFPLTFFIFLIVYWAYYGSVA